MADWTRNDYVRLTIQHDESFMYHVYVVASDWPNMYDHHDDECWIVAVHDNDWTQVGTHLSTCFVNRHAPVLLYRDPE